MSGGTMGKVATSLKIALEIIETEFHVGARLLSGFRHVGEG